MNMNVNNQNMNSQLNCSRKQSKPVHFGMAAELHKSAYAVIKHQSVALSDAKKNAFIESIRTFVKGQENNPVQSVIRKAKRRMALVVQIFDSPEGKKLGEGKAQVVSQRLIFPKGTTGFLKTAENKANHLNATNNQVQKLIADVPESKMDFSAKKAKKGATKVVSTEG